MRFTLSQTANSNHDARRVGNFTAVTCEGVRMTSLPPWRSFMRNLSTRLRGMSIQRWSQRLAYLGWQTTSLRPVPVVKLALGQPTVSRRGRSLTRNR